MAAEPSEHSQQPNSCTSRNLNQESCLLLTEAILGERWVPPDEVTAGVLAGAEERRFKQQMDWLWPSQMSYCWRRLLPHVGILLQLWTQSEVR